MLGFRILRIIAVFLIVSAVAVPFRFVSAQYPFGGPIIFAYPNCQVPPASWLIVGPPVPGGFMYMPGAGLTYPSAPPSHTGQLLLGLATGYIPCIILIPCFTGVCPIVIGGGMLIIMSGASV